MFSHLRNSYLQSCCPDINPKILNKAVEKACSFDTVSGTSLHTVKKFPAGVPSLNYESLDVTRRPRAFGRNVLPKLRRELHHEDILTVIQALATLCDLCHDAEKAAEAISLQIPSRMVSLIVHEKAMIRERACMALTTLSNLADGKLAIIRNVPLMQNIALCVDDIEVAVRLKVAYLMESIAEFWQTADQLVVFGFIELLLNNLVTEDANIVSVHLRTLKHLMYGIGKDIALDHDGIAVFIKLLDSEETEILKGSLDCLTILCSTKKGKKLALEYDLLNILYKFLKDDTNEIHTSAASALMFCTVNNKAKIVAGEMEGLADRLVQLSLNWLNPSTQLFSLKCLTNISEHPKIRILMKERYLEKIEGIQLGDEVKLKHYKDLLVGRISWRASDLN